jgi:hypothetical protein
VSCLDVRERLPESTMGLLGAEEAIEVERHLAWCAGCRKEARELGSAAATLGYSVAPVELPDGLEDQVVARVRSVTPEPGPRRRGHTAIASIVAAMVGVSGLGWGAVMAGRADRFAERAALAEASKEQQLDRFRKVVSAIIPGTRIPTDQTHLAQLTPASVTRVGGGAALELISPTTLDFVIVRVAGLDPDDTKALPYRVTLGNADGRVLRVGPSIDSLDASGAADVFHQYNLDLSGFTDVRVADARGKVVLHGTIDQSA